MFKRPRLFTGPLSNTVLYSVVSSFKSSKFGQFNRAVSKVMLFLVFSLVLFLFFVRKDRFVNYQYSSKTSFILIKPNRGIEIKKKNVMGLEWTLGALHM